MVPVRQKAKNIANTQLTSSTGAGTRTQCRRHRVTRRRWLRTSLVAVGVALDEEVEVHRRRPYAAVFRLRRGVHIDCQSLGERLRLRCHHRVAVGLARLDARQVHREYGEQEEGERLIEEEVLDIGEEDGEAPLGNVANVFTLDDLRSAFVVVGK